MAFIAPGVLLTVHATGIVAGWSLKGIGAAQAEAELLWELKLDWEPCLFAVHRHYPDDSFRLAAGGKAGQIALLDTDGADEPSFRVVDNAHKSDVTALAFCGAGQRLASAGRDRLIKIWHAASSADSGPKSDSFVEALSLEGCEAWPLCLSFSHDGSRLASGCMDNGVYLWDVGESVDDPLDAVAFEHHGWVVDVAWTPDDRYVAAASWDNTIGIYEAAGLGARYSYAFHGDYVSNLYFPAETPYLVSASYDQTVGIWNWREARLEKLLYAHTDWVLGLERLGADHFVTISSDNTACIWQVDDFLCVDLLGESVWGGLDLGSDAGLDAYVDGVGSNQSSDAKWGVRSQRPVDAERAVRELHGDDEATAEPPLTRLDSAVEAGEFADRVELSERELEPESALSLGSEPVAEANAQPEPHTEAQAEPEANPTATSADEKDERLLGEFLDCAPDDLGLNSVSSEGEQFADKNPEEPAGFAANSVSTRIIAGDVATQAASAERSTEPNDDISPPDESDSASHIELGIEGEVLSSFGHLTNDSDEPTADSLDPNKEQTPSAKPSELSPDATADSSSGSPESATEAAVQASESNKPSVSRAYGNATQIGMPSEVEEILETADPSSRHCASKRSGTLTGAKPLRKAASKSSSERADEDHAFNRAKSITMTGQPPLSHDKDAPAVADQRDNRDATPSTAGLAHGEPTAARDVALSGEFQTPPQHEQASKADHSETEATTQISGEHLGALRDGKFEPASSGRLSPGDSDTSDLNIPDVSDTAADVSADQEVGPEVIETDLKDLWERRSAASAPGMGIVRRPLPADASYEKVREYGSPHRWTYGVDIFPKTKLIASCGGDETVIIWGFDGLKKHQFEVAGDGLNEVAFTPDGTMVLAGGDDSLVHAWLIPQKTLAKADTIRHAQLAGHESWISSLAISANGKVVVSGSFDGTARAWHLQDGELGAVLAGHRGPVSGVGFCDKRLLSGGHDGSVRVWNAAGLQIDQLDGFGKLLCLDATKTGSVFGSATGQVAMRDNDGTRMLLSHKAETTAVDILRDGAVASAGKDGLVHLYAAGETEPFQSLELDVPVWALRRIDDYLAVGTDDGKVLLYKRS